MEYSGVVVVHTTSTVLDTWILIIDDASSLTGHNVQSLILCKVYHSLFNLNTSTLLRSAHTTDLNITESRYATSTKYNIDQQPSQPLTPQNGVFPLTQGLHVVVISLSLSVVVL